jgi:hypothetical protein
MTGQPRHHEVRAMTRPRPDAFDALQASLEPALRANRAGSTVDHVVISMPSYSVSESILSHYGDRIPSLEHRYLLSLFVGSRIPACEIVYVSTRRPDAAVLDYYTSLMPPDRAARFRILDTDDGTPRSVAAKILADPALQAEIRAIVDGRPALIEPWNVTETEVAMALALGVPVNGTRPDLRTLGFKSEGRRLIRRAGVPVPAGVEDVRTVEDVHAAIESLQAARPDLRGVVLKHDDSGAGDGNVVLDLEPMAAAPDGGAWLRATLAALPDWYRADLAAQGGVIEERVTGLRFTSPSAQADIRPDGSVQVLATHEQVLGGASNQVYMGCRFPADPAYAATLATHTEAIGHELAAAGALGRFAVDFVAASGSDGSWDLYAIEVNLRKGGTTHPYAALRCLVPGRYDTAAGHWVAAADGSQRAYSATDNLVDPRWTGLAPAAVIAAVRDAGLQFRAATGTGAILYMLSGLAIDGRLGVVAIAPTPAEADALQLAVREAVDRLAGT